MRLSFSAIPPLVLRRPSMGADPFSGTRTDDEDFAERMIKWAWLGGMMFFVAFLLPAIQGGLTVNRPWQMAGWEMAYLAHVGFMELATTEPGSWAVVRRIRPLTEPQAMGLAGAAILSNWLVVASCGLVYVGYRLGNPRKWAKLAARAAFYAAALGLSSTLIWVTARNLSPQIGCVLWCAAPVVMWWGLWRLSRTA